MIKIIHFSKTYYLVIGIAFFIFSTFTIAAIINPLMKKPLNDYNNKEGVVLTVEYAPGESSKTHRHDAHTFVYVIEGSIIMQLSGQEPVQVNAGETFYESPEDIHLVSKNSSDKYPAKFVVFILKTINKPILSPVN